MMVHIFYFFVLILYHVAIFQLNGQEFCTPSAVQNLVLYDTHLLSWNLSPNEICKISYYMVYISREPDWEYQIFMTNQTVIDVGHLPQCTMVTLSVAPVSSESIEGNRFTIMTKTPAPSDANLNLIFLRLSPVSIGLLLEWDVADEWRNCVKEYRLVRYNEDDDDIVTLYLQSYPFAYIYNIIPCTSYVFTVTALYNLETEGRVSVIRYTSSSTKIDPPELQNISVGTTTADLTWVLPGPTVNRCPVTALIVDGSPYFNISYSISSQNQVNRPPINVHLTGLRPDTMYWLRVSANNTAGFSDPAIIGVQTSASN